MIERIDLLPSPAPVRLASQWKSVTCQKYPVGEEEEMEQQQHQCYQNKIERKMSSNDIYIQSIFFVLQKMPINPFRFFSFYSGYTPKDSRNSQRTLVTTRTQTLVVQRRCPIDIEKQTIGEIYTRAMYRLLFHRFEMAPHLYFSPCPTVTVAQLSLFCCFFLRQIHCIA